MRCNSASTIRCSLKSNLDRQTDGRTDGYGIFYTTWLIDVLEISACVGWVGRGSGAGFPAQLSASSWKFILEILPFRYVFYVCSTFFGRISWPLEWEEGNFNKRFLANLCGKVESPSSRNGRRWKFYHPRRRSITLKCISSDVEAAESSTNSTRTLEMARRRWAISHLSHRRVFFQFHRWMECLERGMVMKLFPSVIADKNCHPIR